ncbi:MAG: phage holin family protein [Clostridiales bacterium]|nr:phage holin family protein [Clostridiales bacterium]
MNIKEHQLKLATSLISGLVASFWGIYGPVILCVLIAICMDVISGLVASMASGEKISSQVGWIGFWKKMALLLALAFGIFMDSFIPILLGTISLELPFTMPIGTIVGCYIVINEAISIIENINKAAPTALPKWIKKILEGAGKTIDNGGSGDGKDN